MEVIDFGLTDYGIILNQQQSLFETLIEAKKSGKEEREYVLIGEHPSVITMGRRAVEGNILQPPEFLEKKGIKVFKIGRGGDVTYHCEGQLILYPIIDLERHRLGVKEYVNLLEETVINVLAPYGLKGERIEGATGVWLGKDTERERKICAIGVKCSRFCTMHGLSLNVNSDLSGFEFINPCGFKDKGVTSMARELKGTEDKELEMSQIKKELLDQFLLLLKSHERQDGTPNN